MVTTLAFLFVLGVLVFVHELGHFLVARWHGVRVITFSLGFGPKLAKVTRGGTEYCVSAVPLGGYVKMAGESLEETRTGAPDEFMSKSKWVRFQVYLAGPVMNLLLALVVLAVVLSRGATVAAYHDGLAVIGAVDQDSPAAAAGLQAGDRVVRANGDTVPTWDDLDMAVAMAAGRTLALDIDRGGSPLHINATPRAAGEFDQGDLGIHPVQRPQVLLVNPGTPAERGGVHDGDVILAINGEANLQNDAIVDRIHASAGRPMTLTVERAGERLDLQVTPEGAMGSAQIGVSISPYEVTHINPNWIQAITLSAQQNWQSTVLIGKTLRGLVTRETPMRQLVGPVGIAELSGTYAAMGFGPLFSLMAMISLNLGLLNLLPVPILDGGHIAILAIEGLARRDLSLKVKERILMAGAVLLALLMVTDIYNDISRLLR
jgi:regulator of sigma E protease